MAIQHLFAFSATVDGALIAAGSPYGCGGLPAANTRCYSGPMSSPRLDAYWRQRLAEGHTDDVENLRAKPVVVFQGTDDEIITNMNVAQEVVRQVNLWNMSVTYVDNVPASHVWVTDNGNCSCGSCPKGMRYGPCCDYNNCGFDMTGLMMNKFYGSILPRATAKESLVWINQTSYLPEQDTWVAKGMNPWALAYVPDKCRAAPVHCKVHINYHGCIDNDWTYRSRYITELDVNAYAESNEIIVIYPQSHGTANTGLGCWNWGAGGEKDDPEFDTRKSVQLRTVENMVAGIATWVQTAVELPIGEGPPGHSVLV